MSKENKTPTLPLAGTCILDFSRLLPGPYLTQLLTDLGAEVIKVETPRIGDHARMAPAEMGLGNLFEAINRGKKSIAVNYRNPSGREIVLRLALRADILIEGFRPGSVQRWGIDYDSIIKVKPDIIYCSLSGYGQEGPYRDRAGHDLNYLAIGGALALNARQGEAPIPYGVPLADLSGGMLAAIAILGALVGRHKNGHGMYLDIALLDGVLSWMTPMAGAAFFSGLDVSAGRLPLLGGLPCFNIYETSDGKYLSLAAIEPSFWGDFCRITCRGDLSGHQFDRSIGQEIAAIFRQRTSQEWISAFASTDGCVEPIISFEETLKHPQVQARGCVLTQADQPAGMNSPFVFARRELAPAPRLGENTQHLLKDIGMNDDEIDQLSKKGIIGL